MVAFLIQIPAVQTYITSQVTKTFEEQWGTRVEIGKVNLTFFETAVIEDIYLEDQSGDTLLYAQQLKADIGLFALFGQRLVLDEIALENAYINLYRHADSSRFNYEFIPESFATSDTVAEDTTGGGFEFDIEQVRLQEVRFNFIDDSSQMELRVNAPYFLTEFETLGLEEEHIQIENIDIDRLEVLFRQIAAAPDTATIQAEAEPTEPMELDSAWLNPSGFRFTVDKFTIEESQIHFQTSREAREGKVNPENLLLADLDLLLQDFYLAGDTLRAKLEELNFLERNSNFELQNLAFEAAVNGPEVKASLQEFITAHSRLEDEIELEVADITAGEEMLAQLQASADVREAVLSMKDAAYFTDALDTLPQLREQDLRLSLDMEVADNEASIDKLEIRANDGLYLNARAYAQNIDQPEQMRFDVQLQELTTSIAYLQALELVEEMPQGVGQAGNITLTAQAEGSMNNANLAARLQSGIGNLQTNILYKAPTENSFLVAGNIDARQFDLRPFAGDTSGLGKVSLTSRIRARGQGEAIDINKFSLLVQQLEFNDYTYEGLEMEGFFIDSTLEVSAAYQDPFLDFDFLVRSDLKDSLPLLTAEGNIEEVNFLRLNLMQDSIILSTKMTAELKGQDPDEIVGFFKLEDTELIRGAESWTMDSLLLTSQIEESGREIALETEFMAASLTGQYTFEELPEAFDQFAHYYSSAYQADESKQVSEQRIELDMVIRDEPVIAKAFVPELELTLPVEVNASFASEASSLSLNISAPGIVYDSVLIRNFIVKAQTVNQVISYQLNIDQINSGEAIDISEFALEGNWQQDSLHFDLALAPPTDSTHLLLGGALTFAGDTIGLELDQTDLALEGKEYMLADDATFRYAPNYIYIQDFILQHGQQHLSIFTEEADSPQPRLIAEIRNFEIAEFMDLAGMGDYGLASTFNGDVLVTNPSDPEAIQADLNINDIIIDGIPTGDLSIKLNKAADDARLITDISLEGPGNDLQVNGFYHLEDTTEAISLDIDINRLQLEPWEPFVQEFLTQLKGSLQGEIAVRGSAAKPAVDGALKFGEQTAFRLEATGVTYRLQEQSIELDTSQIHFDELTLLDPLGQELVVTGDIHHQYFENFLVDMQILAKDFQLVDKARSLQEPFYGNLSVQTDLSIKGPLEDIQVEGELTVNEGTDLTLVLLEEERTVSRSEFITFVDRNAFLEEDTATISPEALQQERLIDVEGFSLNMMVHITPESEFTVIVDPATGDFLQISGQSELRITMNPRQDINMQGTFEVTDGRYRLSFLEVIQKNFDIEKGSTVEFNGDPLNARLDLTAIYVTEASRYPLIADQEDFLTVDEINAAKRRRPVQVHLSMLGTLEDPEFSFDIVVPETDIGATTAVAQQIREIKQDQNKLFRQVFGLIVMNRFIPESPSLGGGGGGAQQAINARVDQSLSSFLTDQLNAISQDYLGVSIEVDVESRQRIGEGDAAEDAGYTEKDIGLQLGRSFFNDRLEVKVGGTTAVGGGTGTAVSGGDSGTQFAGNFEVLYHINERGNLNLKIFQRNERNLLTNEFIPQPGVALSYTKSFEELSGFVGRARSQREVLLESEGAIKVDPLEEDEE